MANEKNLTPFTSEQSHDEAVKNGKKGGVASGAARRRKKTMRQTLNAMLGAGLDVSVSEQEFVEKVTPRLLALGINVENATYQDVLLAGMMLKAIRGDVRAAEFIRDTGGDNPHLDLKKQELKLRREELRFKQEQVDALSEDQKKAGEDSAAVKIICDIPRVQPVADTPTEGGGADHADS